MYICPNFLHMGKFYTLLLILALLSNKMDSQSISTNTLYSPTDPFLGGITFNIENTLTQTIRITSISSIHTVNAPTQNAVCKIWYRTTPIAAYPGAINALNGWTLVKTQTKFGLSTTISPFVTGLNIDVPAGAKYAFFIESDKTSASQFIVQPKIDTFTNNGVRLITGTNIGYSGPIAAPLSTPRGFIGTVNFQPIAPCNALPNAGTINYIAGFCNGQNKTYEIENYSFGDNLTFQWQSSTDGVTFTDIAGQTGFTLVRTMGTNSFFRMKLTCTNTSQTAFSPAILDTLYPPAYCTCNTYPQFTSEEEEEILEVNINGTSRVSDCSNLPVGAGLQSVLGKFTDWKPIGSFVDLKQGSANLLKLNLNTCGTQQNARSAEVFIDLNGNRIFDEPSVFSISLTNQEPVGEVIGVINIPSNAGGGLLNATNTKLPVLMRIIYKTGATAISACPASTVTYASGEIEDHIVNLEFAPNCSGMPTAGQVEGTRGFCPGELSTFSNINSTVAPNVTRVWDTAASPTGPWGTVVGQAGQTISLNLLRTTYVRCKVICNASGLDATTPVFLDTVKNAIFCECKYNFITNASTSVNNFFIQDFVLNGHYNTSLVDLSTGMSTNPMRYSDFRYKFLEPVKIHPNEPFNMELFAESTTPANSHASIFLDTNMNGLDMGDRIFATNATVKISNSAAAPTITPNITLNSSKLGLALLRVVYRNVASNSLQPCQSSLLNAQGEVHDYLVNIYRPEIDLKLISIDNLTSGCSKMTTPIQFTLNNKGKTPIAPILTYTINGGAPIRDTFGLLNVNETKQLTFNQLADFTNLTGIITVKVWINNIGDENIKDNELELNISNFLTPHIPNTKNDTVCSNENVAILSSESPIGYESIWYKDILGTVFDTISNSKVIKNPTTSQSFYSKSAYFSTASTGLPNPVLGVQSTVQNMGHVIRLQKALVKINSVDVHSTSSVVDTLIVALNTSGGALIRRDSFFTSGPGVYTLPLNYVLTGTPGVTQFRLQLFKHRGAQIDTPFTVAQYAALNEDVLKIMGAFPTSPATRYPFFYNYNLSYPFCESPLTEVKSVFVNTGLAPIVSIDSVINVCSFPQLVIDAGNSSFRHDWSSGEKTQKIEPKSSGTYTVTVTDNASGCNTSASSKVTIRQSPIFSLGKDTSTCSLSPIYLKSGFTNAGYNHKWTYLSGTWPGFINEGDRLRETFNAKVTGFYELEVKNTRTDCIFKDTTHVKIFNSPIFTLGKDEKICKGDSILKQLQTASGRTFKWHDNSMLPIKLFKTSTFAHVTVRDSILTDTVKHYKDTLLLINDPLINTFINNKKDTFIKNQDTFVNIRIDSFGLVCPFSDTFIVNVVDFPKPNIGDNLTVCDSLNVRIEVPVTSGKLYAWSNGSTTNSTIISRSGQYMLTVTEQGTICSEKDTVNITFIKSPKLELGPNRVTCNAADTVIATSGFDNYTWSGGSALSDPSKRRSTVNGKISLAASHTCGIQTDEVNITFKERPVAFSLPNDTFICEPLTLSITPQPASVDVIWSTGEVVNSITVDQTNIYTVTASNECATITDVIFVEKIEPPIADFTTEVYDLYGLFRNQSLNAISHDWDFGDGNTSTLKTGTNNYKAPGEYQVTLKVKNKCNEESVLTKTIRIFNIGIKDKTKLNLNLFPNPSTNQIWLTSNQIQKGNYFIKIYNFIGQLLLEKEVNVNSELKEFINISNLSNGNYILKFENINGQFIENHSFEVIK